MKKRLFPLQLMVILALVVLFCCLLGPGAVMSGTVSEQPYGYAFPKWYDYASGAKAQYYVEQPTLTGNDVVVTEDATQTLTNKTLTSPTLNGGTLDNPTAVYLEPVILTYTPGVGYEIDADTEGVVFEIPLSGATEQAESDNCPAGILMTGTTVVVHAPTQATHGRPIFLRNTSSGGTPFVVKIEGNLPIQTASGTTLPGLPDAQGDMQGLQLRWNSEVSGYRLTSDIQ